MSETRERCATNEAEKHKSFVILILTSEICLASCDMRYPKAKLYISVRPSIMFWNLHYRHLQHSLPLEDSNVAYKNITFYCVMCTVAHP